MTTKPKLGQRYGQIIPGNGPRCCLPDDPQLISSKCPPLLPSSAQGSHQVSRYEEPQIRVFCLEADFLVSQGLGLRLVAHAALLPHGLRLQHLHGLCPFQTRQFVLFCSSSWGETVGD